METAEKWKVYGYDTFSNNRYPILPQHEFDTEALARQTVKDKLAEIERDQPAKDAGNPDEAGSIQDTMILVHPDGSEEAFNINHLQETNRPPQRLDARMDRLCANILETPRLKEIMTHTPTPPRVATWLLSEDEKRHVWDCPICKKYIPFRRKLQRSFTGDRKWYWLSLIPIALVLIALFGGLYYLRVKP
jgi:hypothetical protein